MVRKGLLRYKYFKKSTFLQSERIFNNDDKKEKGKLLKMDITRAMEILGQRFSFSAVDTDKVIQALKLPQDANILDVGTGLGNLAITLALNGYKVVTGEPEHDETIYAKQDWHKNATKVKVDHLIEFQSFDAIKMPFDDHLFDAVFSLGTFHHIEEASRVKVLSEFLRTTTSSGLICLFEPNPKAISIIRERDPSHPEAADPVDYIQTFDLAPRIISGVHFDAFVLQKPS
jgi:ubiquinone/menaquinone biosynthesis C-methylase UbiE